MRQTTEFSDLLVRAFDANVRYYEALAEVTADYLRGLSGVMRDAPSSLRRKSHEPAPSGPPDPPAPAASGVVLQGAAGEKAQGVFVVTNRLPQKATTRVASTPFRDPAGEPADIELAFDPEVISLDSGEQQVVQVTVPIGSELEAEADYSAHLTVPGLSEGRIPVVVRRTAAPTKSPTKASGKPGRGPRHAPRSGSKKKS